jgi:hypothetical protein
MDEWESTTAVTIGIGGAPPAAVVGDGDDDLAVRGESAQPDQAWYSMRGEGVFGSVCESFIYRQGKIVSSVIINQAVDPSAEGPAQYGGVMRGRRHGNVKLRGSQPLRRQAVGWQRAEPNHSKDIPHIWIG